MERIHNVNSILVLLLIMVTGCSHGQTTSMQQNKEIVARQFEQWQQGKVSFFDLLADDAVWEVSGNSPVSGVYDSKSDLIKNAVEPITGKLAEPLKPELISLSADEPYVWLHFRASAPTKAGDQYVNTYAWKIQLEHGKITKGVAFLDTHALTALMNSKNENDMNTTTQTIEETKAYIGMWVTQDGHIRHELLPNNRYDEARGNRKSAYQGRYTVKGNHIEYKDDTGFTADGEFRDGILYHGGMIFYKEKKQE